MKGVEATQREQARAGEPEESGEDSEPGSGVLAADKWGDSETEARGARMCMSPLSLLLRSALCVAARETLRHCALRGRC